MSQRYQIGTKFCYNVILYETSNCCYNTLSPHFPAQSVSRCVIFGTRMLHKTRGRLGGLLFYGACATSFVELFAFQHLF